MKLLYFLTCPALLYAQAGFQQSNTSTPTKAYVDLVNNITLTHSLYPTFSGIKTYVVSPSNSLSQTYTPIQTQNISPIPTQTQINSTNQYNSVSTSASASVSVSASAPAYSSWTTTSSPSATPTPPQVSVETYSILNPLHLNTPQLVGVGVSAVVFILIVIRTICPRKANTKPISSVIQTNPIPVHQPADQIAAQKTYGWRQTSDGIATWYISPNGESVWVLPPNAIIGPAI
jgi:hypothetical protein